MRFRILGPLEVWDGRAWVPVGAEKQRTLLAVLVLDAGRPVHRDRLVDALWGERPPQSASRILPHYVWRLRQLLTAAGPDPVQTGPAGYMLRAASGEVDLDQFTALVDEGRRLADDGTFGSAINRFTAALALWRGPALADARSVPMLELAAQRLDQTRVEVVETLIETQLADGRHVDAIAALEELTAIEPYRERPWGMLMRALQRAGRRPDALAVYRRMWRVWTDELGIEPGHEMREAHRRLLNDEADPRAAARPNRPFTIRPAQLPPDLLDFTGRDADVGAVVDALTGGDVPASALRGVVVYGQGGVGKTALAIRAGNVLRTAFPDGQLFVNLQATQPTPLVPAQVLAEFLRSLGLSSSSVPEGLAERAQLFRSVAADRRILVVLDNAADEAQVRPLLPGPGGAAIVTARRALAGLEGFLRVHLDVLDPIAAVDLLGRIVGPSRVQADTSTATEIVQLCGRLPLAVRTAGARLSTKPHWSLGQLASRLADERRRLDELRAGDLEVRASLASSHAGLDRDEQVALAAAARLPAGDLAAWPIAALCDVTDATAEDLIERLVDAQLAEPAGTDTTGRRRYRLHDLTRLFALERLADEKPDQPDDSIRRLLDTCARLTAYAVAATDDRVRGFDASLIAPLRSRYASTLDAIDADPFAWYAAERSTLVAAVDRAGDLGLLSHAWRLAHAMAMFLEYSAAWDDWGRTHEQALRAARAAGDRAGQAAILAGLGRLELDRVHLDAAIAHLQAAADLARDTGAEALRAQIFERLAQAHQHAGRREEAGGYARQAMALAEAAGDVLVQVDTLRCLAWIDHLDGRLEEAKHQFEQALALVERTRSRHLRPWILADLARVHRDAGDGVAAAHRCRQAITLAIQIGDRRASTFAQLVLGEALRLTGDVAGAAETLEQALAAVRELHDDHAESLTIRRLGIAHSELGRHEEAYRCLAQALSTARSSGRAEAEGVILLDLGRAQARAGQRTEAIQSLELSIVIFGKHSLQQFHQQAQDELQSLAQDGHSPM